jgi:hypothetical protein
MWFYQKGSGIVFTLKSKQETRCFIAIIIHRLELLERQLESGEIKENIHQFYKFCGLLVSRKENICISLVLVAHF